MPNTGNNKNLSDFARAALDLDAEFSEIERLSGAISNLSIESESGLDRAQRLLANFNECGERIGGGIQELGAALEASRARAEAGIAAVAAKAEEVRLRQEETDRMLERFKGLGDMVRTINTAAAQLKKANGETLSDADKTALAAHLPQLDSQVSRILEEIQKLRDDARGASMRQLERDADSMGQALKAVRNRLSLLVMRPSDISMA